MDDEGGAAEVWSAVRDGKEMQQMNISAVRVRSGQGLTCGALHQKWDGEVSREPLSFEERMVKDRSFANR